MKNLNNIQLLLNGTNIDHKRKEIKEYFVNTFTQFEKIFNLLKNDKVFYKKSEITRHPMIFYFGHTATFFINKLILKKVISKRINKNFESIFAIGVDEMSWDDLNDNNYSWPKVSEVRQYRDKVKDLVLNLIDTIPLTLPITWDSDMWIILMGIEHERIHIETSLVLHRQMPLKFINTNIDFKISQNTKNKKIKNELITINESTINLGKKQNSTFYGWDNEYGEYSEFVNKFQTSKYLVSNSEYMPFVLDNSYENEEYWCEKGKEFLKNSKIKHPIFWIKEKNSYKYRTINKIISLPLSWPVEVNAYEAKAFLNYKSKKENKSYLLPSEAQYKAIYNFAKVTKNSSANHNLDLYSSCPIDTFGFNGIYDVIGNVWQWSSSKIFPFEGFKVHEIYDDFTVPTFDNNHTLIKGSSWASSGNLIDPNSRYAFREHFYQNAGFRYIINTKENIKMQDNNIYETNKLVSQYCEFQYGKEHFGVQNFSLACANIAKNYINKGQKALDIGCATGRLSFELAKYFEHVDGIDFSASFIDVGVKLKKHGELFYKSYNEGELFTNELIDINSLGYESIKNKVDFHQGDACNLKDKFNSYDMIIASNLIDRLYQPKLFLNDISHRLNDHGILILTSPYTWLEEYTKKENWLGGFKDENNNKIYTIDTLKDIFKEKFDLVHTQDVPFLIKETQRKYQHTLSQLSVWRKKTR